jgi:hypothetical protein
MFWLFFSFKASVKKAGVNSLYKSNKKIIMPKRKAAFLNKNFSTPIAA